MAVSTFDRPVTAIHHPHEIPVGHPRYAVLVRGQAALGEEDAEVLYTVEGGFVVQGQTQAVYLGDDGEIGLTDIYEAELDEEISKAQLASLERALDKLFAAAGIDVEFTRHFMDRVNAPRNGKPITVEELAGLFRETWAKFRKTLEKAKPNWHAILQDVATAINIPIVMDVNSYGELELVAKTVMRKKDFTGREKRLRVRSESLDEAAKSLNVATVPLVKARAYAEEQFSKAGKSLDEVIPDFDKNYVALQKATKKALNIPRVQMPVIEPTDMSVFEKRIKAGKLDIFKPWARGKLVAPTSLSKKEGEEWVQLGWDDGDKDDDKIPARITTKAANTLLPTQSQIWLEKLVGNIIQFGVPASGSPIAKAMIIVSKEGYILDGHHRFGQAMLANPTLAMRSLFVPLDIKTLLKIGRAYGEAIGNKVKEGADESLLGLSTKLLPLRGALYRALRFTRDSLTLERARKSIAAEPIVRFIPTDREIMAVLKDLGWRKRGAVFVHEDVDEGVNDPFILKAIFLTGGAGSGKSFVAQNMFGGMGLKFVNSDTALEREMKKAGLDLTRDIGKAEVQREGGLRDKAKLITTRQQSGYMQGRLGLIIDSTAAKVGKVEGQVKSLRSLGYDCYMVFVNTSLETALARNQDRSRTVPEQIARQDHAKVQKNIEVYRRMFGTRNFAEVLNDDVLSPREVTAKLVPQLTRVGLKFLNQPVKNPVGKAWVNAQMANISRGRGALAASYADDGPRLDEDIILALGLLGSAALGAVLSKVAIGAKRTIEKAVQLHRQGAESAAERALANLSAADRSQLEALLASGIKQIRRQTRVGEGLEEATIRMIDARTKEVEWEGSLQQFLRDNADDQETVRLVRRLRPGQSVRLGGGASPEVIVQRNEAADCIDEASARYGVPFVSELGARGSAEPYAILSVLRAPRANYFWTGKGWSRNDGEAQRYEFRATAAKDLGKALNSWRSMHEAIEKGAASREKADMKKGRKSMVKATVSRAASRVEDFDEAADEAELTLEEHETLVIFDWQDAIREALDGADAARIAENTGLLAVFEQAVEDADYERAENAAEMLCEALQLDEYRRQTMGQRMKRLRARRTGMTQAVKAGKVTRTELKRENRQKRRMMKRSPSKRLAQKRYRRRTRQHRARVSTLAQSRSEAIDEAKAYTVKDSQGNRLPVEIQHDTEKGDYVASLRGGRFRKMASGAERQPIRAIGTGATPEAAVKALERKLRESLDEAQLKTVREWKGSVRYLGKCPTCHTQHMSQNARTDKKGNCEKCVQAGKVKESLDEASAAQLKATVLRMVQAIDTAKRSGNLRKEQAAHEKLMAFAQEHNIDFENALKGARAHLNKKNPIGRKMSGFESLDEAAGDRTFWFYNGKTILASGRGTTEKEAVASAIRGIRVTEPGPEGTQKINALRMGRYTIKMYEEYADMGASLAEDTNAHGVEFTKQQLLSMWEEEDEATRGTFAQWRARYFDRAIDEAIIDEERPSLVSRIWAVLSKGGGPLTADQIADRLKMPKTGVDTLGHGRGEVSIQLDGLVRGLHKSKYGVAKRVGKTYAAEAVEEVAPPGFEGTVKAMKRAQVRGDIDPDANLYALAWAMKNKGAKSHRKADGTKKQESLDEAITPRVRKLALSLARAVKRGAKSAAAALREISDLAGEMGAALLGGMLGESLDEAARISSKDPMTMTAAQINKELDRLDAESSKRTDAMIAAGRGNERFSEIAKSAQRGDALAKEIMVISNRQGQLRDEAKARYGPKLIGHLPTGRGFGPRKRKGVSEGVDEAAGDYRTLNDAAVHGDGYAKGSTEIWYMKPGVSRDYGMGLDFLRRTGRRALPTAKTVKDSHVLVGKIAEKSRERVFGMMQGERWSPNGEARTLILKLGLHHTSMSVGDVVKIGGTYYFCDRMGFKKLS